MIPEQIVAPSARPRFSKGEKKMLIASSALAALLILSGTWWRWMNADPVLQIPTPTLPKPNAFDFYVQAGQAIVKANPAVDPVHDTRVPPTSPQEIAKLYPTAAKEAWLRKNAKAFNLLRQGFQYRCLHPPTASKTLSPYASIRELARLLVVESHARAERGNWEGASQSALDIMKLGNDVPRGAALIGALVSYAIQAIGRRELWNIAPHLNASEVRGAAQRLEELIAHSVPFADTLQEEKRYSQAAILEAMHKSNWRRSFLEYSPWQDKLRLWFISKRTVLRNYSHFMDILIDDTRRPYTMRQPLPEPGDPATEMNVGVLTNSRWHPAHCEAENTLFLITLVLRAYQLEHGRYPAQLSELVPRYLKRIPADPFGGGEPLRYQRSGQSYVLWSIGPDGVDNKGHAIDNGPSLTQGMIGSPEEKRRRVWPDSTGDIVAGINK